MASRQKKKQRLEQTVDVLALERLRLCFDRFDRVVVSFSGGKDSTACVQLALHVAREVGKLPLDVFTFDEEAIPPETVAYLDRISRHPDLRFYWYCLPVEHRNACSRKQPYWYPWAAEDRERWVRELPPRALTELDGFRRQPIPLVNGIMWPPRYGSVCLVMGIRTQESMMRYGAIARKSGFESFLAQAAEPNAKHITKAYPIYDWTTDDVWLAPHRCGWDYNRAYDVMEAAGLHRLEARCSPPYGEQPIRRLWAYKVCWPELWAKMTGRVVGAATAARYANTDLYGIGETTDLLESDSWRSRTYAALRQLDAGGQGEVAKGLQQLIADHYRRTGDPLPDGEPHPQSGFCWRRLYPVAAAGGNKFGRQLLKVRTRATETRIRNGF